MSINPANNDGDMLLERAAEQAIDLRATVMDLSDPALKQLVEAILFRIGIRIAKSISEQHRNGVREQGGGGAG